MSFAEQVGQDAFVAHRHRSGRVGDHEAHPQAARFALDTAGFHQSAHPDDPVGIDLARRDFGRGMEEHQIAAKGVEDQAAGHGHHGQAGQHDQKAFLTLGMHRQSPVKVAPGLPATVRTMPDRRHRPWPRARPAGAWCGGGGGAGSAAPALRRKSTCRTSPRRTGHSHPWQKSRWRRSSSCGRFPQDAFDPFGVDVTFQDQHAYAHKGDGNRIGPGGEHHQQHRQQHVVRHRRRPGHADRGALMQGVPPFDREIDHRHVDHADQCKEAAGPVATARVVDGGLECQHGEVQEQQDQLRRQPRIPHPPGAPHRLAPQGAGPERQEGEHGAGRHQCLRHHERQAGVHHQPHRTPERHHDVDQHRHPRGRHVQENDAVAFALLEIGRRHPSR